MFQSCLIMLNVDYGHFNHPFPGAPFLAPRRIRARVPVKVERNRSRMWVEMDAPRATEEHREKL